jgi:GWxTD domain-containing protein
MHLLRLRNQLSPVFLLVSVCLPFLPAHAQPGIYKRWLDEDVHWIITSQERAEFAKLATTKQFDQFVEAFWSRRDPTPGTQENEFKKEHYRRMAFANTHFAATMPGWKTDRGRIYIVYGPPDRVESYPSAVAYAILKQTSTVHSSSYPFEVWHYKYMDGVNRPMTVKFVDVCRCGNYQREINSPEEPELP